MNRYTQEHLARWLAYTYPPEAEATRDAAEKAIKDFVAENPDVLERLSWPEILQAATSA